MRRDVADPCLTPESETSQPVSHISTCGLSVSGTLNPGGSTGYPGRNTVRTKATHVLEAGTAHGEVADEVPDQGDELADGRDEGEEKGLELRELATCTHVHLSVTRNEAQMNVKREVQARDSGTICIARDLR
jgi:hypothetical protein